jgi:general secretion pathway protein E
MDTLTKDLTGVWRKLGRMLATGVPLLRALRSVIQETPNEQVRAALADVVNAVESGSTFSAALSRHAGLFPPSVLTLANSGEMTGTLERSAMAIADGLSDGSVLPVAGAAADSAAQQGPNGAGDEAEAVRLANEIISRSLESRATDIHMSVSADKPRIRMRVDGVLTDKGLPAVAADMYPQIVARIKLMAGITPAETQKLQDGRIMLSLKETPYDLRVNCTPCASGESVVMRILARSLKVPTLKELGLPDPIHNGIKSWLARPNGIVVVCGPTGSGKTTTLYSVLQEVNVPGAKVMSVEDPVEYRIDGVDQVQVRPSHGITFASALRSMLRQDPDIILVGEIRDLETAQVCVQIALTGHLVLTTLHTDNAPSAVCRLMDVGIEPYLVNGTLIGVLAQRLVRKVCQKCKEEYTPDEALLKVVRARYPHVTRFVRGKGCETCRQSGYRNRAAVMEMFELSGELRALLAKNPTADELYAHAVRCGMRTMQQDGMDKVAQGITTVEEVFRVCG